MSCVSSFRFVVLINGVPSSYFKGNRGILQGCSLSLYLFILAIEGLILLIHQEKTQKKFSSLKVSRGIFISHILFVNDVIIIGGGSIDEWIHLQNILKIFSEASGLEVSENKSSLIYFCKDQALKDSLINLFPFKY